MAKKQLQIKGTERAEIPDIERAAESYREVRDERAELSKRESQKRAELLATMRAHKVKKYLWHDQDGEEWCALIDDEPVAKVKRTGEAEPIVGEGIVVDTSATNGVHPGLIAQAEASMKSIGVEVSADGEVVAPSGDASPSKKKRKRS